MLPRLLGKLTFTKKQKGPMKQWSLLSVGFSAGLREAAGDWQWKELCCRASPILCLAVIPFDPYSTARSSVSFQNYFLTERKKQTPDNVYLHFGPKWLQSPAHGCLCPLYPPQHCQGNCGEGLVVSCVDLVPVSAWETHSTGWAESVCHWVGFDSFTHFVASDVFSYRKTDM